MKVEVLGRGSCRDGAKIGDTLTASYELFDTDGKRRVPKTMMVDFVIKSGTLNQNVAGVCFGGTFLVVGPNKDKGEREIPNEPDDLVLIAVMRVENIEEKNENDKKFSNTSIFFSLLILTIHSFYTS
ncbi:unnamed protein product [Caenorhabditis auriculariae]|uniref:Uncharacterized protein n=1 Tax=Caenorhabditis auriculariae TaxID=2777116 RepID=A0A8S1HRY0_9PELO|nr:unnamed protein product [Caenorhabditis auriculariae]